MSHSVKNMSLAFDQWCLRCTLCISWKAHICNEEVRWHTNVTNQPPLTHIICTTRLKLFGHTARADPSTDHSQALRARVVATLRDWNCQWGQPCQTWLRTVESDLAPLNVGLVLQPPINEHEIVKSGARLWEWQRPALDKPHNDDDDFRIKSYQAISCNVTHNLIIQKHINTVRKQWPKARHRTYPKLTDLGSYRHITQQNIACQAH